MLVSPTQLAPTGHSTIGGTFALTETEYDLGVSRDIERSMIGADGGFNVAPEVDLIGQVGLIFDSEVENSSADDGSGFMLGGGARFGIHQSGKTRLFGYGMLNFTRETFDGPGELEYEITLLDLHAGGAVAFLVGPTIQPWVGLELVLHSDGDLESKVGDTTSEIDVERDDRLGLRGGVNFRLPSSTIRLDMTLVSETSFLFGMATTL